MHRAAYQFIERESAHVPNGPVLEIGSRQVNGMIRHLFTQAYHGIDIAPGPGVDEVADGATFVPETPPSVVVCAEVLEHARGAADICRNAARILTDDGVFILTAAGDRRAPHSAVDGGPVRDGEFYRNVSRDDLEDWLAEFAESRIEINHVDGDIYAVAYKRPRPARNDATRALRVMVVHPGASVSTADVFAGLVDGLRGHGVTVIDYRLDGRIRRARNWLHFNWRQARKQGVHAGPPTEEYILNWAGRDLIPHALHHQVDCVILVSALLVHPEIPVLLRRAGVKVCALLTETPYDMERESAIARVVDGVWTNERSAVVAFRTINPNVEYLPHGWHPARHLTTGPETSDVPAHDVVFVGTAFPERIRFFESIDWTGIDLGLYGDWKRYGIAKRLHKCVRRGNVVNAYTAALYRRAKIGINLHRTSLGFGPFLGHIEHAESMNPRGYELAACGSFFLSDDRAEVGEIFGELVPTFTSPREAEQLIRRWLPDDVGRAAVAAQLPAVVAESSWAERSGRVIGDLAGLLSDVRFAA